MGIQPRSLPGFFLLAACTFNLWACQMEIQRSDFGTVDDQKVTLYTLKNANGLLAKITNYGAIVTELHVPNKQGKMADIVHGFNDLASYRQSSPYFGATIGRIGNRIANAAFTLEGKTYKLAANNGKHHLHGGKKGWDKVIWDAEARMTAEGPVLELTYVSPAGEEGYPGTVTAKTIYTLNNDNQLRIDMTAVTDQTTVVNMVHHSYWNLGGTGSGLITNHLLKLHASHYTPSDKTLIPTGKVAPVKDTPFDFTQAKPIGRDLKAVGGDPAGYDHNWVVDGDPDTLRKVAWVKDPASGRVMEIFANQPGVQFYTGNFMDGSHSGKGAKHRQYSAFCLETQAYPDAINKKHWAEQVVLKPGEKYHHVMIHTFSTD
ncbi:MAG: aldose epimerase family protein [Phycisphaeraceae bacterium]|nr:aldose epimerase family protein [Phycisphaeraceae bacterium]